MQCGDDVRATVAAVLDSQSKDFEVIFGSVPLGPGSYEEFGIEDGARLAVQVSTRATIEQIVQDLVRSSSSVSPSLRRRDGTMRSPEEVLTFGLERHEDGRVKNWNLCASLKTCGIEELPESFGDLVLTGNLNLCSNGLTSLPTTFGNICCGGTIFGAGTPDMPMHRWQ